MGTSLNRNRRLALVVGPGAIVLALTVALTMATRTSTRPEIEYVGGDAAELPTYGPTPEDLASALGVSVDHVNVSMGGGFAPGDCTALGPVPTQEEGSYGTFSEAQGLVITTVARFHDAAEASALMTRIRDDIQDCDRSVHRPFARDLEAIQDVNVDGRAFLLAAINDHGTRDCWIWVQNEDRVGHLGIYELDPSPTIEHCAAAARVAANAIVRG